MITSVTVGGIQIHDGTVYAAGRDMAYALEAMVEREPVAVAMADRHPFYVRDQVVPRTVPIVVMMLQPSTAQRRAAYNALLVACQSSTLIELTWNDGSAHTLDIHVRDLIASSYYTSASGEAVAFNPEPR